MADIFNMVDTWNDGATTFTAIKMNATDTASAAGSLLMDLQVGGVSAFSVQKTVIGLNFAVNAGQLAISTGQTITSLTSAFGFNLSSTTARFMINIDTQWTRRGAANWRMGLPDAAAPVAQTLSVQSVVAGTTNTAGANLTITGSQGTGTGAGGSIIFQVAPAGSSGTAQNALVNLLEVTSTRRLSLYNTFTDATTFERANIFWDSNVLKIGTEKGSVGGTARALELQTDGTTRLTIAATTGNVTTTGSVTTEAPTGGTAAAWRLGTVASVTPTLQNRTIEVDIGGTIYYISAKTTND